MFRNEVAGNGRAPRNEVTVVRPGANYASLMQIRIDSKTYPRLHSIPLDEARRELEKIVLTAFQYVGRETDTQTVMTIADNLLNELLADLDDIGTDNVTLEEISRVVKRAVLGQRREMYGINFASLYAVIADYCRGEGYQVERDIASMERSKREKLLAESAASALIDAHAAELARRR